jgi:hypothetical protein
MEDAADVDVDHPVPLIDFEGLELGEGHDAGVIDDHIESAEFFDGEIDQVLDVIATGHVHGFASGSLASGLNFLHERLQTVHASGTQYDASPPGRQQACCRLTYPAASASDDHDFVLNIGHDESLVWMCWLLGGAFRQVQIRDSLCASVSRILLRICTIL